MNIVQRNIICQREQLLRDSYYLTFTTLSRQSDHQSSTCEVPKYPLTHPVCARYIRTHACLGA